MDSSFVSLADKRAGLLQPVLHRFGLLGEHFDLAVQDRHSVALFIPPCYRLQDLERYFVADDPIDNPELASEVPL